MQRVDKPGIGWYQAQLSISDTMDALEWCIFYPSKGEFYMSWRSSAVIDENLITRFEFSDKADQIDFILRWN